LKKSNKDPNFVLPRSVKWDRGDQAKELRFFLKSIGLPEIRFHDLRATWATLLLADGKPAIKVMKAGGWEDMKTMDGYCRLAGVDIEGLTDDFELV
jgi:integrase